MEDYRDWQGVGKDVCVHKTCPVVQEMVRIIWRGGLQGLTRITPGVGKDMSCCTGNGKDHMAWRTTGSGKDHIRNG